MNDVLAIVSGIPLWVPPLLLVLIAIGVRALKTRYVPLAVALIAPVAFTVWGIITLLRAKPDTAPVLSFVIAALIGVAIAIVTTRDRSVTVDTNRRRVCLPGSYVPLIRNLSIFVAKFALTFAVTVNPDIRDTLSPWDLAVSGISSGYFVAWSAWLLAGFSRAMKAGGASTLQNAEEPGV